MIYGIILAEGLLLYVLSRRFTQNIFIALFLLTKSRVFSVSFLSLIYFPGTVIHELAHMFTAEVLGVRTGGLTLVPEGLESSEVRAGSVMIVQTDPVRRAVIGVAPVFVGMAGLFLVSYFLPGLWNQAQIDAANGILFSQPSLYYLLFTMYALFAISNTMFASKEDMEGFWPVAIVISLLFLSGYLLGVRLSFDGPVLAKTEELMLTLVKSLGLILGINMILFIFSVVAISIVENLTGRRIRK